MTYPTALNSACFVKTSVLVHEHNIFSWFWRLGFFGENLCCISKAVSFSSLTNASQGLWRGNSVGQFDLFSWITVKNVQTASDLCQPSRRDQICITRYQPMICCRNVEWQHTQMKTMILWHHVGLKDAVMMIWDYHKTVCRGRGGVRGIARSEQASASELCDLWVFHVTLPMRNASFN